MKKFFADLKKPATEIINFEKKDMLPLTEKQKREYNIQKFCHICKQELDEEFNEDQNYYRVEDHCHCLGKYRRAGHA